MRFRELEGGQKNVRVWSEIFPREDVRRGNPHSFPQQQAGHYKSQISTRITNTNVLQYCYYLSCKPRPNIYVQKLIHA